MGIWLTNDLFALLVYGAKVCSSFHAAGVQEKFMMVINTVTQPHSSDHVV